MQATVSITETYLDNGIPSGSYAVVVDVGDSRYWYQPKGLQSYPQRTAEFFAYDLTRIFAGACDVVRQMRTTPDFVRVA
jgi:hypothetical protein